MTIHVTYLWNARTGSIGSGNTNHIRHWAVGLQQHDVDLTLLSCYQPSDHLRRYFEQTPNLRIVFLPQLASRRLMYLPAIYTLRKWLREHQTDVLHTVGLHSDLIGAATKRIMPELTLLSAVEGYLTGYDIPAWKDNLYRKVYKLSVSKFDAITAITGQTRGELIDEFAVPAESIHVIHSGVIQDELATKKGWPLGDKERDYPIIGLIGRLSPEKGGDLFLETAARILHQIPSARFVIAGDGSEKNRLITLARHIGVADSVSFLGWVTNINSLLAQIDILVVPSVDVSEGLPWTVLESLAVGTPIVATRSGGIPEVIKDEETGLLVSQRTASELSEKVLALWNHEVLARRVASEGMKTINSYFNVEREAAEMFNLYRTTVRSRRH